MRPSLLLRLTVLIVVFVCTGLSALYAQSSESSDVISAMQQSSSDIHTLYPIMENIAAVVMAIMGVIAGVNVFSKWVNGDHHARQSALNWFGAIVFGSFLLIIIRAIFI